MMQQKKLFEDKEQEQGVEFFDKRQKIHDLIKAKLKTKMKTDLIKIQNSNTKASKGSPEKHQRFNKSIIASAKNLPKDRKNIYGMEEFAIDKNSIES